MSVFSASPCVAALGEYAPARHAAPCDLNLAGTGAPVSAHATRGSGLIGAVVGASVAQYPDARPLAAILGARIGIGPDQVLVAAGADEALERATRAVLAPGRNAILTDPTFEMLPRYAALTGAELRTVSWPGGEYPADDVISRADAQTALVAIVTPNNPTGAVATLARIRQVHDAIPTALILVDLAYVEFADDDPTPALLTLPRVVITRTMSKAWALPGIRVGYAAGASEPIRWLRRAGGPFSVAATSLDLACAALAAESVPADVSLVRAARDRIRALLAQLGAEALPSQANFACVVGPWAAWLCDALAGLGIATRFFPSAAPHRLRITIPADAVALARLERAINSALAPEALLFDMDGVLADVSESYRKAIRVTAEGFGVQISDEDVRARKANGNANDDWQLTTDLIVAAGRAASLHEVQASFERTYQGTAGVPGLHERERLTVPVEWLESLATRFPLAVVTGRPRVDAERFLDRFGIRRCFGAVITRDDGPLKPDAFPVRAALTALGVSRAWMFGDTPDDMASARAAEVVPVGVVAPGDSPAAAARMLSAAGAGRVITSLTQLTNTTPWLP